MAPDPAYIHCSWNVNNDQFWPMTDLRPVGTKCEARDEGSGGGRGVEGGGVWVRGDRNGSE